MYWEADLYPAGSTLWKAPPGAGKRTLGLQFLREGRRPGERGLFITLSETNEELEVVAASHGWSLDGIDFFGLTSGENLSSPDRKVTLLHPWEVELGETIKLITGQADRTAPSRVVFESVSEMRLLADEPLRFHRQVSRNEHIGKWDLAAPCQLIVFFTCFTST